MSHTDASSSTTAAAAASYHPQRVQTYQRKEKERKTHYDSDLSSSSDSSSDDDDDDDEPPHHHYQQPEETPMDMDEKQPHHWPNPHPTPVPVPAATSATPVRRVQGQVTKVSRPEGVIESSWPGRMPQLGDWVEGHVDRDATGREEQLYYVVKTPAQLEANPLPLRSDGTINMDAVNFQRDIIQVWFSSTRGMGPQGAWTEEPKWVGKFERYKSFLYGADHCFYPIEQKAYERTKGSKHGKLESHITQAAGRHKRECGKVGDCRDAGGELDPTKGNHDFVGPYWRFYIPSFQLDDVRMGDKSKKTSTTTTAAPSSRKRKSSSTATTAAADTKRLKFDEQSAPMEEAVGFMFDIYLQTLRTTWVREAKEKGTPASELLVTWCNKLGEVGRKATHPNHHGHEAEAMDKILTNALTTGGEPLSVLKRQLCRYHAATSVSAQTKLQSLHNYFLHCEAEGKEPLVTEPTPDCMDIAD